MARLCSWPHCGAATKGSDVTRVPPSVQFQGWSRRFRLLSLRGSGSAANFADVGPRQDGTADARLAAYSDRRKFNISCFALELSALNLVITAFASEPELMCC